MTTSERDIIEGLDWLKLISIEPLERQRHTWKYRVSFEGTGLEKGNSLRLTVEILEKHGRRKTDLRIEDIEYEALLQAHRILFPGSAQVHPRPSKAGAEPTQVPRRPAPLQERLWFRGKEYDCTTAQAAMVIVLRELANLDRSFLQRCAGDPDARGRKRRYIATTPADLYPDRADLQYRHKKLPRGWVVATDVNNEVKVKILRLAARMAELDLVQELVLPAKLALLSRRLLELRG